MKRKNNSFLYTAQDITNKITTCGDISHFVCFSLQDIVLGNKEFLSFKYPIKEVKFFRDLFGIKYGNTFENMEARLIKKSSMRVNVKKMNDRRVLALLFAHWAYNS